MQVGTLGISRHTWVGPCVWIVCCRVGREVFGKFGVDNLGMLHECNFASNRSMCVACTSVPLICAKPKKEELSIVTLTKSCTENLPL